MFGTIKWGRLTHNNNNNNNNNNDNINIITKEL